eukprot:4478543-Pyramimonas_sp.AAC.1
MLGCARGEDAHSHYLDCQLFLSHLARVLRLDPSTFPDISVLGRLGIAVPSRTSLVVPAAAPTLHNYLNGLQVRPIPPERVAEVLPAARRAVERLG